MRDCNLWIRLIEILQLGWYWYPAVDWVCDWGPLVWVRHYVGTVTQHCHDKHHPYTKYGTSDKRNRA